MLFVICSIQFDRILELSNANAKIIIKNIPKSPKIKNKILGICVIVRHKKSKSRFARLKIIPKIINKNPKGIKILSCTKSGQMFFFFVATTIFQITFPIPAKKHKIEPITKITLFKASPIKVQFIPKKITGIESTIASESEKSCGIEFLLSFSVFIFFLSKIFIWACP